MADKGSLTKNFPEDYGKAVAPGYEPSPFFFRQFNEERGTRIVAWSGELEQMKRTLYSFLSRFPDDLVILLKVEDSDAGRDDEGVPTFKRYRGDASRTQVVEAVRHHERYVFLDGHHQLCVRCADSGEYFAFDEDGILWLYPNIADEWASMLVANGFSESAPQKLLSNLPHWQFTPAESEEMRNSLIQGLGLEKVG